MSYLTGKRILITGGAGMLGSTIAIQAVAHGAQVTVLDAMLPLYGGNLFNLRDVWDVIEFVEGDIRDKPLVEQLVTNSDIIFDLAAQVSYVDSQHMPLEDLDINCRGHLIVLEACRRHNRDAILVFPSSRFVYGTIESNPVRENHPNNCLSIYGIHKLAAEKYFQLYYKAYGLRSIVFRIANPYGPRQQMKHSKYGIVNWFIRLAMEGRSLTVYGEGEQQRDYVYVEDLAHAMLMAVAQDRMYGQVFNIGSGSGTAFKDMARLVAEVVGTTEVRFVEWPQERYFVETGDYVTDLTKLRQVLDWQPEVGLREGIERTFAYYRAYRQYYW